MPASVRVSELAERKERLVAEAELHRSIIALEYLRLTQQSAALRETVAEKRWWWVAGAAAAGWLTARGDLARWLPFVMDAAQLFRSPPR